jgi:hypothetical protein
MKTFKQHLMMEETLKKLKVGDMSPQDKIAHERNRAEGENWHMNNPVDHMNIVDHFDRANPGELHNGKTWYSDAHHFSKAISKSTGVPHHTVAGLTANYSPQTDWHTNMLTAARVARHKKPVGGGGQKQYFGYGKTLASEQQKTAAERLLKGEHYSSVLSGHKVSHFAHLIEHGGNADHNDPHVAIDRHAHSVASGARISDAAFSVSGLKSKKRYDHLKNLYVSAADHINNRSGATRGSPDYIHPHQVQAVTWLVRQRMNNEEDLKSTSSKTTQKLVRAGKSRITAKKKWQNYSGTWHPELSTKFRE